MLDDGSDVADVLSMYPPGTRQIVLLHNIIIIHNTDGGQNTIDFYHHTLQILIWKSTNSQ